MAEIFALAECEEFHSFSVLIALYNIPEECTLAVKPRYLKNILAKFILSQFLNQIWHQQVLILNYREKIELFPGFLT